MPALQRLDELQHELDEICDQQTDSEPDSPTPAASIDDAYDRWFKRMTSHGWFKTTTFVRGLVAVLTFLAFYGLRLLFVLLSS